MTYPKTYDEWAASDAMCRRMETRRCPTLEGCGDTPCARFESDDETPWLNVPTPPHWGMD